MTRFRNVKLGVFRQHQNTKKRKMWGRIVFKNFKIPKISIK